MLVKIFYPGFCQASCPLCCVPGPPPCQRGERLHSLVSQETELLIILCSSSPHHFAISASIQLRVWSLKKIEEHQIPSISESAQPLRPCKLWIRDWTEVGGTCNCWNYQLSFAGHSMHIRRNSRDFVVPPQFVVLFFAASRRGSPEV